MLDPVHDKGQPVHTIGAGTTAAVKDARKHEQTREVFSALGIPPKSVVVLDGSKRG